MLLTNAISKVRKELNELFIEKVEVENRNFKRTQNENELEVVDGKIEETQRLLNNKTSELNAAKARKYRDMYAKAISDFQSTHGDEIIRLSCLAAKNGEMINVFSFRLVQNLINYGNTNSLNRISKANELIEKEHGSMEL